MVVVMSGNRNFGAIIVTFLFEVLIMSCFANGYFGKKLIKYLPIFSTVQN